MQGIGNFPFHAKLDMFASHIRISSSFRWKPPRPKQSIRSFRVRRGWVSGSRLPVSSTYNTYLGFKGIGSPSLSSDTAHSCPHNTHGRSEQLALVSFRINTICINDLHLAQGLPLFEEQTRSHPSGQFFLFSLGIASRKNCSTTFSVAEQVSFRELRGCSS